MRILYSTLAILGALAILLVIVYSGTGWPNRMSFTNVKKLNVLKNGDIITVSELLKNKKTNVKAKLQGKIIPSSYTSKFYVFTDTEGTKIQATINKAIKQDVTDNINKTVTIDAILYINSLREYYITILNIYPN